MFVLGVGLCLAGGCGRPNTQRTQPGLDSAWLAQLDSKFPCRAGGIAIKPVGDRQNCALTMAAIREIANGRGDEFGISKGDTSNVTEVEIFDRDYGEPEGLYWIANVAVKGKGTGLVVLFERTKQRITVTHGEDWGLKK